MTTEFAASHPSSTRNPWDPTRTPGGSSSGSAAAVGIGMIPAALDRRSSARSSAPPASVVASASSPVSAVSTAAAASIISARAVRACWVLPSPIPGRWRAPWRCVPVAIRAITASPDQSSYQPHASRAVSPSWKPRLAQASAAAKQALAEARQQLQAAGIEVIDRTSHDAIAALETAIAEARPLSMAINAWEGRWPLNTYASDMDRHGLSSSAQGRLAEAQTMSQAQYQGLLSERQRIREVYAALHTVCDACMTLAPPVQRRSVWIGPAIRSLPCRPRCWESPASHSRCSKMTACRLACSWLALRIGMPMSSP